MATSSRGHAPSRSRWTAARNFLQICARLETRFLRTREAKILRGIGIVRLHAQRFIELDDRLRNLPLAQKNEAEIDCKLSLDLDRARSVAR